MRDAGAGRELDVLLIAVPRAIVTDHLNALEAANVRARSVSITPVALLDLVSFCPGGESAQVAILTDDGGAIELDIVAGRTLVSSHLVRAEEVGSAAAVRRLVADEALPLGPRRGELPVYLWGDLVAQIPSTEPSASDAVGDDPLASGADLVRRAEGLLGAPEAFFVAPDPVLAPAIGAALAGVREGEAGLNLLPPEEQRAGEERAPLLTFLLAALVVLVTAVWLVSAMVKDYRISTQLHDELASLEPAVREVHENESAAKELRDKLKVLTQGDGRVLTFLHELTEVIPPEAYLSTFRVRNDRAELEGFARSASDLVPLLEKSKRFKNAQFTSPVTKVHGGLERFSLTTEIEE